MSSSSSYKSNDTYAHHFIQLTSLSERTTSCQLYSSQMRMDQNLPLVFSKVVVSSEPELVVHFQWNSQWTRADAGNMLSAMIRTHSSR